ncbi:MAG TPA: hypothetical protein VGW12_17815 [Pyrinomonadaceae bacterium]|nr:hypothetical protein [Pyrinomonadaceae bacterium]
MKRLEKGARQKFVGAARMLLLVFSLFLFPFFFSPTPATAQEIVDRWVATINNRELITYTDLLWQLALQPDTPIDQPRSEDLQRVLNLLIDQRLISQEAGKLPTITPSDADVDRATNELVKRFPSQAAFYERLARVGLTAEGLREIVRQRVEIENYLNFRFRSFTIISTQEIADYYRDVYVPRHRRLSPGRIVPTLEQATPEIERTLTEAKIESDTDAFLEDARTRAEIVILNQV